MRKETDHHPFCNFWMIPKSECKYCEKYEKQFPSIGMSFDSMVDKYFPEVVRYNLTKLTTENNENNLSS